MARGMDRPAAALVKDLKARGMLEDTIVIWTTEFGRMPCSQGSKGRDHSPRGFSTWMAGGGVKGGQVIGATDDFGYAAVENPVHVHDLHASMLHLMGLDHKLLTYFHAGRNMRITDVSGRVVKKINCLIKYRDRKEFWETALITGGVARYRPGHFP
jgi:arylsulfatase A-like enzyme